MYRATVTSYKYPRYGRRHFVPYLPSILPAGTGFWLLCFRGWVTEISHSPRPTWRRMRILEEGAFSNSARNLPTYFKQTLNTISLCFEHPALKLKGYHPFAMGPDNKPSPAPSLSPLLHALTSTLFNAALLGWKLPAFDARRLGRAGAQFGHGQHFQCRRQSCATAVLGGHVDVSATSACPSCDAAIKAVPPVLLV